jgi:hypothetical protein
MPRNGLTARGRHAAVTLVLLIMIMGFVAPRARAQGSCTVPHGSPATPTNSFVLTEEPGNGWVQLTLFHLNTRNQFDFEGTKREYFSDGHLITTSIITTLVVGVVRGVDVWAQLPLHTLSFAEQTGERSSTGFGDPRFYVRLGPQAFGAAPGALPVGVAIRAGVKFPGAALPVDQQIIPITEGQRDYELLLEVGKAFQPVPVYAMGWFGYRWREENGKIARDPGDERFAYLAVGTARGPVTLRVAMQGLWGSPSRLLGLRVPSTRRRMLEILPTVGRRLGPGEVQLGARLPVAGRNLPAGAAFSFGYFLAWGNRTPKDSDLGPLLDHLNPDKQ